MDYNKKRWVVLVVSCIVNIIIGTGYAWSVFAGPWAQELGIQNAALAFTVCNAVGPVTMITGGKINDMLGPKWVVFVGGFNVRRRCASRRIFKELRILNFRLRYYIRFRYGTRI